MDIISHVVYSKQHNLFGKYNGIYVHAKEILLLPFLKLMTDGSLGVNVFFVISGFLITSLMLNEEKRTNTVSLKGFYTRRILRIFPAYYFLLLVYFILQSFHIIYLSKISWLTSLTYTKDFNRGGDGFTAHVWSLSVEEQFYLFYPLLFLLGNKVRKTAAWLLFFIPIIVRLYISSHATWINALTLPVRIDAIATGCLLALYKDKIVDKLFKNKYINRNPVIIFWNSLMMLYLLEQNIIFRPRFLGIYKLSYLIGGGFGTLANIAVAMILVYSFFEQKGRWFKLLNSKVLNYIGILSYSIYLWQQIFILGFAGKYWIGAFPQNLLFIFAAALFSHYVIERPFLKLKERFKR